MARSNAENVGGEAKYASCLAGLIADLHLNCMIRGADYVALMACGNKSIIAAIRAAHLTLIFNTDDVNPQEAPTWTGLARTFPNTRCIIILTGTLPHFPSSSLSSQQRPIAKAPKFPFLVKFAIVPLISRGLIELFTDWAQIYTDRGKSMFPNLQMLHLESEKAYQMPAAHLCQLLTQRAPHVTAMGIMPVVRTLSSNVTLTLLHVNLLAGSDVNDVWHCICSELPNIEVITITEDAMPHVSSELRLVQFPPKLVSLVCQASAVDLRCPLPEGLRDFLPMLAVSPDRAEDDMLQISRLPSTLRKLNDVDWVHRVMSSDAADWAHCPSRLQIYDYEDDAPMHYLEHMCTLAVANDGALYIYTFQVVKLVPMMIDGSLDIWSLVRKPMITNETVSRLFVQLQAIIDAHGSSIWYRHLQRIAQVTQCAANVSVSKLLNAHRGLWEPNRELCRTYIGESVRKQTADWIHETAGFIWPNLSIIKSLPPREMHHANPYNDAIVDLATNAPVRHSQTSYSRHHVTLMAYAQDMRVIKIATEYSAENALRLPCPDAWWKTPRVVSLITQRTALERLSVEMPSFANGGKQIIDCLPDTLRFLTLRLQPNDWRLAIYASSRMPTQLKMLTLEDERQRRREEQRPVAVASNHLNDRLHLAYLLCVIYCLMKTSPRLREFMVSSCLSYDCHRALMVGLHVMRMIGVGQPDRKHELAVAIVNTGGKGGMRGIVPAGYAVRLSSWEWTSSNRPLHILGRLLLITIGLLSAGGYFLLPVWVYGPILVGVAGVLIVCACRAIVLV